MSQGRSPSIAGCTVSFSCSELVCVEHERLPALPGLLGGRGDVLPAWGHRTRPRRCPALGHLVKIIPSLCFSLASQPVLHPPPAVPARGVRLQEQPLHPGALEMRRGQRLPGQQRRSPRALPCVAPPPCDGIVVYTLPGWLESASAPSGRGAGGWDGVRQPGPPRPLPGFREGAGLSGWGGGGAGIADPQFVGGSSPFPLPASGGGGVGVG